MGKHICQWYLRQGPDLQNILFLLKILSSLSFIIILTSFCYKLIRSDSDYFTGFFFLCSQPDVLQNSVLNPSIFSLYIFSQSNLINFHGFHFHSYAGDPPELQLQARSPHWTPNIYPLLYTLFRHSKSPSRTCPNVNSFSSLTYHASSPLQ